MVPWSKEMENSGERICNCCSLIIVHFWPSPWSLHHKDAQPFHGDVASVSIASCSRRATRKHFSWARKFEWRGESCSLSFDRLPYTLGMDPHDPLAHSQLVFFSMPLKSTDISVLFVSMNGSVITDISVLFVSMNGSVMTSMSCLSP